MVAIASPHMPIAKATPRSGLPIFLLFMVTAGTYTYMTAREEGRGIDAARTRFLTAKQRNDLRITGGAPILHEDETAAHLPSIYKGPGALAVWK